MNTLDYLVLVISLIWFISENIIDVIKLPPNKSKLHDEHSTLIMNIASISSLVLGVGFGIHGRVTGIGYFKWGAPFIGYLGLFIIIAGITIRWIAIFTLKKQFTVIVAIIEGHQIINNGIYRYIRHPSYLGGLLIYCGLGISLLNWISLVILSVPILFAILYRIKIEEKMLIQYFGDEYMNYAKKTKRLIPKIY